MSGTKEGGRLAAITNKELYGEDFYRNIGREGGKAQYYGKKGFAANKELARIAGKKGGTVSKRGRWSETERKSRLGKPDEVKYIRTPLWESIKKRIKTHG